MAACSNDVVGRPPLSDSGSEAAFGLISRWSHNCIQEHHLGRQTLSAFEIDGKMEPLLPRRVIDIHRANPRVLDTATSAGPHRGHYAALSHCWGQSPPLITTKSNFSDRLAAISFRSMPRTFQDAVTVAQRMGLSYIWIDSLCRVQDSLEDWMPESERWEPYTSLRALLLLQLEPPMVL